MQITRKSQLTGKVHTLELPVTEGQLEDYHDGMMVQHAFPDLPKEQREFIKTGITPEEWEKELGSFN